jgi:hypothetical protein
MPFVGVYVVRKYAGTRLLIHTLPPFFLWFISFDIDSITDTVVLNSRMTGE